MKWLTHTGVAFTLTLCALAVLFATGYSVGTSRAAPTQEKVVYLRSVGSPEAALEKMNAEYLTKGWSIRAVYPYIDHNDAWKGDVYHLVRQGP